MKIFNSLTKQKEEFKPITEGLVKMYSCGPTVYYYPHIGNMRAYLFMDMVRRVFMYNGYKIEGVMNYTDVGHLTSDGDEGDDKMDVAAKRENKSPWEIAEFYINVFNNDLDSLNIIRPEHCLRATNYIAEMIEFNKGLEAKGYTYLISDGLYFDVQKFKGYGKLSNKDLSSVNVSRIEENPEKHHPFDFALWKFVDKSHIMKWDSPWGVGCPGWHIECSAMSKKILGDEFDIHTGGIDHKSVHHECEIAQNDALAGNQCVKSWLHCEFLQVEGGKMGKSLGNLLTLKELEEKGFSPLDFRYFSFTAHYRKKINFTIDALTAAANARKGLIELAKEHKAENKKTDKTVLDSYKQKFVDAISDDFNMPLALAVVWALVKEPKSKDIYELLLDFDKVLGLDLEKECKEDLPKEVLEIAERRQKAREEKNWALSDELRNEIQKLGYNIKDGKDGYAITKL